MEMEEYSNLLGTLYREGYQHGPQIGNWNTKLPCDLVVSEPSCALRRDRRNISLQSIIKLVVQVPFPFMPLTCYPNST